MTYRFRRSALAVICACALAACSQRDATAVDASTPATAGPTDDPCALVPDGEVAKFFPGASSGERDHKLDQYGIATCTWDTTLSTFMAQIYTAKGSLAEEMRGRMLGSIDPLKPGAGAKVRYDAVSGLGDEAIVVVEKEDAQQGILGDVAVIGMRRGQRVVVLFNSRLIGGDRAATVAALRAVARGAAARL